MRALGVTIAGVMGLLAVYALAWLMSSPRPGMPARQTVPLAVRSDATRTPSFEGGLPPLAAVSSGDDPDGAGDPRSPREREAPPPVLFQKQLKRLDDWAARAKARLARDPDVARWWARQLLETGRWSEAAGAFARCLETRPDDMDARLGLALSHAAVGRHAEAAEAYEAALRVQPDHVAANFNLAVARVRLGQLGPAAAGFRRVLEIDPGHARSMFNLATLAEIEGRLSEARHWWERLSEQPGPRQIEALIHRGRMLLAQGAWVQAAEALGGAVLARPGDPEAVNALAAALVGSRNADEARPWWLWSLAIDPTQPAVIEQLHASPAGRAPAAE